MRQPSKTIKKFMFEACRRIDMAGSREKDIPLLQKWIGLGTAAAYRPMLEQGLMIFHDGRVPPKRCMGWLVFTVKGAELYEQMRPELEKVLKGLKENPEYARSYLAHYQLAGGVTK